MKTDSYYQQQKCFTHFGDESFQAITYTSTDKQTTKHTQKLNRETLSTINRHRKTQKTQNPLVSKSTTKN